MKDHKLIAGETFPEIIVKNLSEGESHLGIPENQYTNCQLIVVYRGKHCPVCTNYLFELEKLKEQYIEAGIDVIAVSADSGEKAFHQTQELLNLTITVGYDLSVEQMRKLGVYISEPRTLMETETPFSEPAIFVVNEYRKLQVVDISNNPFVRPDLEKLLSGLKWIRNPENDYPIRGTY